MPNKRTNRRLGATIMAAMLILSMGLTAIAATKLPPQGPVIHIVGGNKDTIQNFQAGDSLTFVAADGQSGMASKSDVKVYLNDALLSLAGSSQKLIKGKVVKTTITLQKGSYRFVATNADGAVSTKTLTVD